MFNKKFEEAYSFWDYHIFGCNFNALRLEEGKLYRNY